MRGLAELRHSVHREGAVPAVGAVLPGCGGVPHGGVTQAHLYTVHAGHCEGRGERGGAYRQVLASCCLGIINT